MASLFLAGGAVRDMLLGRPVHDMDFAFSGTEEDFVQRFPHARKTSEHPPIWVAGGFEFCPLTGGSPDEDVMRRDLTVNALLLDDRGRLYMHPRSLDDLREGVLRLFRHVPFSTIPRACIVLPVWPRRCRTFPWRRRLWSRCAKQRRMACWNRFLRSGCAGKHSRRLPPRVLPVFFPRWNGADACVRFAELAGCSDIPAGPRPWHDNSVLEHTGEIMDSIARNSGLPAGKRELAVWMGLCHDLGKPKLMRLMLPIIMLMNSGVSCRPVLWGAVWRCRSVSSVRAPWPPPAHEGRNA